MSVWTHVSGCIRIDGLPHFITTDWRSVLGRPADWDSDHEAENIPGGSEGSIQYKEIAAGTGLVWLTVAVWGDLRDFGTEQTAEIDAWFERIVKSNLMLRSAELLVETEGGGGHYILVAGEDKTVIRIEVPQIATTVATTPEESREVESAK